MADIIDFHSYADLPDPDGMTREELLEYRSAVAEQIARLDEDEPKNMASEAYEAWGDRHEDLEDLADEITDLLEELGGPHG